MYEIRKQHIKAADGTPKWYQNRQDLVANVAHVDLGTYRGTLSTLRGSKSASYHIYLPRHEEVIVEFVPYEGGAWHAGKKANPTPRAQQIIGDGDANLNSFSICYEGLPVDRNGRYTSDWDKVVDGQKATDSQVQRAIYAMEHYGTIDLPLLSHKEITSYKPASVLDFNERIRKALAGETCTLAQFTTQQLFAEIISRISLMRKQES